MKKLVISSRNKGKIAEIQKILSDVSCEILSLNDVDFRDEVEETGSTFEENAILKAKTVGETSGILSLADDSGLEIDALGGRPGVYSARYISGTDEDRMHKVLEELAGVSEEKRTARFIAVMALYNPIDKKVYTSKGINEGYITTKITGSNGFGYDPIFFNPKLGKTNGEATEEEKNRVSHRANALQEIKKVLLKLNENINL